MKTRYSVIETPNVHGEKVGPAQIVKSFSTKKAAENYSSNESSGKMPVMTAKKAGDFVAKWNSEFFKS